METSSLICIANSILYDREVRHETVKNLKSLPIVIDNRVTSK